MATKKKTPPKKPPAPEVSDGRYLDRHKRPPEGEGKWWFTRHKDGVNHDKHKEGADHFIVHGKYVQAVKAAQKWATEKGYKSIHVCEESDMSDNTELNEAKGKVFDPITKKMVSRKPIKQKAGGGWVKRDKDGTVVDSDDKKKIGKKLDEAKMKDWEARKVIDRYNAARDSEEEAKLRTPEGEKKRQEDNKKMSDRLKNKKLAESLDDLRNLAMERKPIEFEAVFNNIMATKIADAVEAKKAEVAMTLFNQVADTEPHNDITAE